MTFVRLQRLPWVCALAAISCTSSPAGGADSGLSAGQASASGTTADTESSTAQDSAGTDDSGGLDTTGTTQSDSDDPKLDLWVPDGGGGTQCSAVDPLDVPPCSASAPPGSFDPATQWEWSGPPEARNSFVMPLVANFTDDNGDGSVDLCDTPDVLVVTCGANPYQLGNVVLLDGDSGQEHFTFTDAQVACASTPAIGDIDNDGYVEVVTATVDFTPDGPVGRVIAFEHDGAVKWLGPVWEQPARVPLALADLDEDGDVEILAGNLVVDHEGELMFEADVLLPDTPAPTAANLDGEPGLEVIMGSAAYHADGTIYYENLHVSPGFPQVAQLDNDPQPEILLTTQDGIAVLEHDGTTKFSQMRPTGDPIGTNNWQRPAAVHDMDGDGGADFAQSSRDTYAAFRADASILWQASVADASGSAGGTAFDFLGDGVAEAMYADEDNLFVFAEAGTPVVTDPRSSGTGIEYPVVADVDNDGSAEIIVVSNWGDVDGDWPTVRVIRDVEDRWIATRRIWNQHTYHVTNVEEDGTIPRVQPRSWEHLNTFRTNAQLENGVVCQPEG